MTIYNVFVDNSQVANFQMTGDHAMGKAVAAEIIAQAVKEALAKRASRGGCPIIDIKVESGG